MRNGNVTLRNLRSKIDARFKEIDSRIGGMEGQITALQKDVRGLKRQLKGVHGDIIDIIETVAEMDHELKIHKRNARAHLAVE